MKEFKLLVLLVVLLALTSVWARAGQITHTVTYDPNKLSVTYDTINGTVYARVNYDDFFKSNINSEPELPYENLMFSVPFNAVNFSAQVQINNHTDIHINSILYPVQAPKELDDTTSVFTQPNVSIYELSSFYPSNSCQIFSYGYMFGDNKVVVAQLSPITYNPVISTLRIATDLSLVINYDINTNITPTLSRYNSSTKAIETSIISQNVINSNSVVSNSYNHDTLTPLIGISPSTLPTYEYCIITSRQLAPAFKKIIAMKRQKGLSAGAVCIEDLMASPICNGGDIMVDTLGNVFPTITDSAGVVREYLKYAFSSPNNPTRFVLMGGKSPNAPVRYLHATKNHGKRSYHIPSDLYFSDLSQIWIKNDSDSVFGNEYIFPNQFYYYEFEPNHILHERSIKFFPDIYVGRLLCNNIEEIDNYSNKLYRYVFNPGNGDPSYLSKAVFVTYKDFNSFNVKQDAQHLFSEQIEEIRQTDNNANPTGSQLIEHLNMNKNGFISLYTHGEPQSVTLYNDDYREYLLTALDRHKPHPNSNVVGEDLNGLDCLNNKYNPSICYSIACVSTPFDIEQTLAFNNQTLMEYNYSMGESFTVGKCYGGPAFLGNTRKGTFDDSPNLERAFYKSIYQKKFYSIGAAEAMSKCYPYCFAHNAYKYMHNLIGDPEFEIWTSVPQKYDGLTISRYPSISIISGITPTDTIAYCDNDGNCGKQFGSNGFDYFHNLSPTASIMVYEHEHIPYLFPLMLQNCDINNSQYVYASSFHAGSSVVPNLSHGNVRIKNGAVYEIEATEDVNLENGFIVENGATFAIKTPGKVTIDGCVFQSGAKVKIEAGNIEFVGKFTAELGSKVEFTQYVDD